MKFFFIETRSDQTKISKVKIDDRTETILLSSNTVMSTSYYMAVASDVMFFLSDVFGYKIIKIANGTVTTLAGQHGVTG